MGVTRNQGNMKLKKEWMNQKKNKEGKCDRQIWRKDQWSVGLTGRYRR
jgi:hypothetical protein